MTKITQVAYARRFERPKGQLNVVRRENTIPTIPYKIVECLGCKEPLKMFHGQLVYWHSWCRKAGRQRMRQALKANS